MSEPIPTKTLSQNRRRVKEPEAGRNEDRELKTKQVGSSLIWTKTLNDADIRDPS